MDRWAKLHEVALQFEEFGREKANKENDRRFDDMEAAFREALRKQMETQAELDTLKTDLAKFIQKEKDKTLSAERDLMEMRRYMMRLFFEQPGNRDALLAACNKGDLATARMFLEPYFPPSQAEARKAEAYLRQVYNEALRIAASADHEAESHELCAMLMRLGADPSDRDPQSGRNALHCAVSSSSHSDGLLQLLLREPWVRAHVDDRDRSGTTPLMLAVHLLRLDKAVCLVSFGADRELIPKEGWSRLNEAYRLSNPGYQPSSRVNSPDFTFDRSPAKFPDVDVNISESSSDRRFGASHPIPGSLNSFSSKESDVERNPQWHYHANGTSKDQEHVSNDENTTSINRPEDPDESRPSVVRKTEVTEALDSGKLASSAGPKPSDSPKFQEADIVLTNAERWAQRAEELYHETRLVEALTIYEKLDVVTADAWTRRNRVALWFNAARCAYRLDRKVDCVSWCNRILEVTPESKETLCQRAEAFVSLLEFSKAVSDFEQIAKLDAGHEHVWRERAQRAKAKQERLDRDLYYVIGVRQSATVADIKKAYHAASLKWHPDKNLGSTSDQKARANIMFKAVAHAYHILSNVDSRKQYDSQYHPSPASPIGESRRTYDRQPHASSRQSGASPGAAKVSSHDAAQGRTVPMYTTSGEEFRYSETLPRSSTRSQPSTTHHPSRDATSRRYSARGVHRQQFAPAASASSSRHFHVYSDSSLRGERVKKGFNTPGGPAEAAFQGSRTSSASPFTVHTVTGDDSDDDMMFNSPTERRSTDGRIPSDSDENDDFETNEVYDGANVDEDEADFGEQLGATCRDEYPYARDADHAGFPDNDIEAVTENEYEEEHDVNDDYL